MVATTPDMGTHGMTLGFDQRRAEYEALWAGMHIHPDRMPEVKATARRIIGNRPRYDAVSRATGVPWYVIGILHALECDFSFEKHLHNGDPLARATVRAPKGRGPFASWEASAIDAGTVTTLAGVDAAFA